MLVEYGKLKMFLVALQGLLYPFSTPMADALPHWVRMVAACLQGGAMALFAYLLKPASQFKPEDLEGVLHPDGDQEEPEQPLDTPPTPNPKVRG